MPRRYPHPRSIEIGRSPSAPPTWRPLPSPSAARRSVSPALASVGSVEDRYPCAEGRTNSTPVHCTRLGRRNGPVSSTAPLRILCNVARAVGVGLVLALVGALYAVTLLGWLGVK